ncbi:MAG TPA: DEAD/DEAH box helicase [Chloroflexota bacterium]|nr:DEAD/DEAH box helicase [Chloroflexota bacterium]
MTPYSFTLDPFQEQALAALGRGASVLVAAPTGVGKTVIAEMAIDRALTANRAALYASPLKALSNQKYRDFRDRYGRERVGILTGDVQENPTAPLLVLTTEILHNRLLCGELAGLGNVSCLVFDEFHYLSDPERGRIWEETIILCPRNVQIVCLSATLPNIRDVAGWMEQQVGVVDVIVETNRPVPLSYHYFAAGELHDALSAGGRPNRTLQRYDARPARGAASSMVDLMPMLLRENMTPALGFMFSRRDTETQASLAASWLEVHAPVDAAIEGHISSAVAAVNQQVLALPQAQALIRCLQKGVGFHHAGVLPELKDLVEHLFGDGALRLLCATETFALGLNMPARTVVLSRITKFDGRAHRELTAREFQQMAGRAGRRGMDERGHVVLMADPWKPFSSVGRLLVAPLEPVRSAFSMTYNTLLNVSSAYGEAAAESLIGHSFLVHQLETELARGEARLAEIETAAAVPARSQGKQLQQARRQVETQRAALTAGRHRKELEVMRAALSELGYGSSLAKAALLRGIFNPNALLIAELLDELHLNSETMSAPEFAELISWFIGDRRTRRGIAAKLPTRLRQFRQLLEEVTGRIQRAERNGGLLLTQSVVPAFPNLICRWCAGDDVRALCREYQLSEGDIAGHLEDTRQLLRQVRNATREGSSYVTLTALADGALRSLADGRRAPEDLAPDN